ncbi:hypothetical protein [Gluconobacter wancherniae]|uniref:hypothetical protein n=1 Tax=Gluconobacter wancherniae TaxID=1307955 RepID=UPI001B8B4822|nr:hypothetical protein [Gluconobacter wancherniae]MBS1064003.1 hypothetical protein [Gluconobacter wancherniae]MBS1089603.1 hypothetical protein [Gluconobacter wancherniae]MBS1095376.1 hypothetical protein [Gluconobacter wancherniae]
MKSLNKVLMPAMDSALSDHIKASKSHGGLPIPQTALVLPGKKAQNANACLDLSLLPPALLTRPGFRTILP